ncbi:hypothetical protein STRTUCAR8_05853, partial [Streptomyces turgidiscabies Car8]
RQLVRRALEDQTSLGEEDHVGAGGGDILDQMRRDEHTGVRAQLLQQLAEPQPLRHRPTHPGKKDTREPRTSLAHPPPVRSNRRPLDG